MHTKFVIFAVCLWKCNRTQSWTALLLMKTIAQWGIGHASSFTKKGWEEWSQLQTQQDQTLWRDRPHISDNVRWENKLFQPPPPPHREQDVKAEEGDVRAGGRATVARRVLTTFWFPSLSVSSHSMSRVSFSGSPNWWWQGKVTFSSATLLISVWVPSVPT